MLAKKERLNRTDFNRFFSSGRRFHHNFFTIIHTPSSSFHGSVVISKKIAPKAVTRNLWRRRVYEVLRNYSHKNQTTGVFIVLIKADALKAPKTALREALIEILGRIEAAR